MPFDGTTMSELGGAGATPAKGGSGGSQTVLRGPVDRSGAQGGGTDGTNFRNG